MQTRAITKQFLKDMIQHAEKHFKLTPMDKFEIDLSGIKGNSNAKVNVIDQIKMIYSKEDTIDVLYCAALFHFLGFSEKQHVILCFFKDRYDEWWTNEDADSISQEEFENFDMNVIREYYEESH